MLPLASDTVEFRCLVLITSTATDLTYVPVSFIYHSQRPTAGQQHAPLASTSCASVSPPFSVRVDLAHFVIPSSATAEWASCMRLLSLVDCCRLQAAHGAVVCPKRRCGCFCLIGPTLWDVSPMASAVLLCLCFTHGRAPA